MDFDGAQMLVVTAFEPYLAVRLGVLETAKSVIPYRDCFLCRHVETAVFTRNNFLIFCAFRKTAGRFGATIKPKFYGIQADCKQNEH